MALVSSQVVAGDVIDSILSAGSTTDNLASEEIGGDAEKIVIYRGFAGRFELELPAGSTIDGVRVVFTSNGIGSSGVLTKRLAMGFLADDGKWIADGISAATYPTRDLLPWPRRWNGTTFSSNLSAWVGGADPVTLTLSSVPPVAIDEPFSFGDGLDAVHVAAGLVANAQSYLDAEPAGARAESVSGTALPVAFCVLPSQAGVWTHGVFAVDSTTEARRPVLEIEYTPPPVGGIAEATPDLSTTVSTRASSSATVGSSSACVGVVSARATSASLVLAESSLSSPAAARGKNI